MLLFIDQIKLELSVMDEVERVAKFVIQSPLTYVIKHISIITCHTLQETFVGKEEALAKLSFVRLNEFVNGLKLETIRRISRLK